jgi:hypothetical protein
VPALDDGVRQYLEIAVLTLELRPSAKPTRLLELVNRAIPYPLVLVTWQGAAISLSLAHKRWSQGEAGEVVIEDARQVTLSSETPSTQEAAFLASLAAAVCHLRTCSPSMMRCWPGSLRWNRSASI